MRIRERIRPLIGSNPAVDVFAFRTATRLHPPRKKKPPPPLHSQLTEEHEFDPRKHPQHTTAANWAVAAEV